MPAVKSAGTLRCGSFLRQIGVRDFLHDAVIASKAQAFTPWDLERFLQGENLLGL